MQITKQLLTTLFTLFTLISFSQTATIINSQTKEKIPYVNIWLTNKKVGTSANFEGEFSIKAEKTDTLVFSAIGFETKYLQYGKIRNIVELNPIEINLEEVVVKNNKELHIGKIPQLNTDCYYDSNGSPYIIAKFFEYKEEYAQTPLLKTIKIASSSKVRNAKFNLRLYSANDKGEPDKFLYNKNILCKAKKGKHITSIDLSDLNIKFPKNGFFIAVEYLIIKHNRYKFTYIKGDNLYKEFRYSPNFWLIPTENNKKTWEFYSGKWHNDKNKTKWKIKNFQNKYRTLAAELILTN